MFSEYASRFLAQSQSRLSFSQADPNATRNPLERQRGNPSRAPSRGYLQRQPLGNPYRPGSGQQTSRFPFASRLSTQTNQAPLFYSATDEFREEDDEEEREREVADFYALQRSRRDFGASRVSNSSESDAEQDQDEASNARSGRPSARKSNFRRGIGIRSSWTGDDEAPQRKNVRSHDPPASTASSIMGKTRDRLVDVELASTIHEDEELVDPDGAVGDESAPSVQRFQRGPYLKPPPLNSQFLPRETDPDTAAANPRPPSPDDEGMPPALTSSDPPKHDQFWATLYLLCVASVFASFILVWIHTSAAKNSGKLGDTIYTTLHSSFYLLAVDTLVAVVVALLWLSVLRSFVRPLVFTMVVAVPVSLLAFWIYTLVWSFKGTYHGSSIQDKAMRWLSFAPLLLGCFLAYTGWKARRSFDRAVGLLEFTTRVLAANPALVPFGFAILGAVILWTWVWMLMFTRVFLGGHYSSGRHLFIIDTSSWWLGAFFVLTYLWTLGIISGIQRTTAAATVSQWYFHRLSLPAPPASSRIVQASFLHSITTIFGTVCLETLLTLAIRLPLLLLPRRLTGYVTLFFYSLVPTSIATLTNPLTLTYAAIHSLPLSLAARGLSEMSFVSSTSATNTLTPRSASDGGHRGHANPILAYRLAKLLLHVTRWVASLAFGVGGWVSTARTLTLAGDGGGTIRGSLYAYVVGLIAGAIGWAVLGAMEGVLSGVLDALIVCWGADGGRYCREAGELFGGGGAVALAEQGDADGGAEPM